MGYSRETPAAKMRDMMSAKARFLKTIVGQRCGSCAGVGLLTLQDLVYEQCVDTNKHESVHVWSWRQMLSDGFRWCIQDVKRW